MKMCGSVIIFVSTIVGVLGSSRIVNGTDAQAGQYPFQVSLRYNDEHICGGTIINSMWILTAAHCFDWSTENLYSVQAGVIEISEEYDTIIDVDTIIPHENYNASNGYINDIAVLKLQSPLPIGDLIKPVELPEPRQEIAAGISATVVGWGALSTNGGASPFLQTVDIFVVSDKDCAKAYFNQTHATNICAGVPQGGKGQCSGDSGGPLLVHNQQVGIVSWSAKPCTKKGFPGVFTEVSHYVAWISNKINE